MEPCPLCDTPGKAFFIDSKRGWNYGRCPACALVYRQAASLLGLQEEKRRYERHENDPQDAAYRRFLAPVAEAIALRCPAGSQGLDYGCGPGPALAVMLGERGMNMSLYDPHFAPSRAALRRTYDFVTCTEAAEHFRAPGDDFRLLARLLRPGGWLALMTSPIPSEADFARWHYRLDPTHIRFYSRATFEWLARAHDWTFILGAPHVALFSANPARP